MTPAPYVVLVSIGDTEAGLWCDACLLPSRVRTTLVFTDETGSSDTMIPPADACTECGKRY